MTVNHMIGVFNRLFNAWLLILMNKDALCTFFLCRILLITFFNKEDRDVLYRFSLVNLGHVRATYQ